MKAIAQDAYGPLHAVLKLADVDRPTIGDDQVLVRVRATSIHVGDVFGMQGVPYLFRPIYGLRRPKARVPGTDMAGNIEAVGRNVTGFDAGDAVSGWGQGTFAEFAIADATDLVAKPADLTFEQAAAVGVSAQTALQGLRDHAKVQAEHKVLINGASGGVGTFAIQIAKVLGAEVTGVCSTPNVALVDSLGADHVIDYREDDFTEGDRRYDIILDNVGNHSFSDTRRALTPDGKLFSNGSPVGGWFRPLGHFMMASLSSIFIRQQGRPFAHAYRRDDLVTLESFIAAGNITPVIDKTFELGDAIQAIDHVASGHTRGTTVISVAADD